MTPSRAPVLAALAFMTALLGYALVRLGYGSLPPLPVGAVVTLLLLAGYIAFSAVATRNRLQRRPGARPLAPLAAAKMAVLGKAAATVGALTSGFWAGALVWLLPQVNRVAATRRDSVVASAGVLAALAVLGTGLALERVCRLRDDDRS